MLLCEVLTCLDFKNDMGCDLLHTYLLDAILFEYLDFFCEDMYENLKIFFSLFTNLCTKFELIIFKIEYDSYILCNNVVG